MSHQKRLRKNQQKEQEEDDEMQKEPVNTKEAPGTSSSGRGERRTETQQNVPVKKTINDEITEAGRPHLFHLLMIP